MLRKLSLWLTLSTLLIACGPSSAGGPAAGQSDGAARSGPRILSVAINEDPKNLWDGINGGGGSGARQLGHMVNQYLVAMGPDAQPTPRLLAEIPSVQTGTWRVFPEGGMEVTYKLRSGVVWHDGTPFTSDDVLFSYQVGRDPSIPNGNTAALRLMASLEAPDAATVVVRWRELYPFADRLEHREFFPLPRHLMERQYRENKETLLAQPFMSSEWIGTGPFRMARWEPGSHIELTAFDNYFLGRPRIDQVRIQFIGDDNTAIVNLMAGTIHTFLPSGGPGYEQMMIVKADWDQKKTGNIVTESVRWSLADVQKVYNPTPRDLTDLRVRQALLHAINRPELAQVLLGDLGIVADSWVHPTFPYFGSMQDAMTKYAFDPRRASTLLEEAGWTRGSDGALQKGGERFNMTIRNADTTGNVLRDQFKAIGVTAELEELGENLLRDARARAMFTGLDPSGQPMGGLSAVRRFITDATPAESNRWSGTNRGGYSNPEWDAIGERMRVALVEEDRLNMERDLVRIFTTNVPALPLYFQVQAIPVSSALTGFQAVRGVAHTGQIMHTGNIHEWDIVRG